MKNKDLIALLSTQDPEADVFLEYDTMCCVYDVFVIAKVANHEEYDDGIYLMCEDYGTAEQLFMDKLYPKDGNEKYTGHTLEWLHKGSDS